MTKLIVFDMDDTLYLERNYVLSGFAAAADELSSTDGPRFLKEATKSFQSGERGNIFNLALQRIGLPDTRECISKLLNAYRHHKPSITLCADADSFLSSIKNKTKTALVSDGYLPPQKLKAEALGLYDRLDRILLTEELGREHWKPHPLAFETLEKEFRLSGNHCVYIGDNPNKDFDAPQRLGWQTVRIKRNGGLNSELPDSAIHPVETQITSFEELELTIDL